MNPLLQTKFFIPTARPDDVPRQRLLDRLDGGMHRKLTLISAPAGFGKTTLASAWLVRSGKPAAWLSLDAEDGDLGRFLEYVTAALQRAAPGFCQQAVALLQNPPPPIPQVLTTLVNELAALEEDVILVLDDYHLVEAPQVDEALAFLVEHLPPQVHLAITTREDPNLPLAKLRARGQLTEIRAADLRFTPAEAASFLNQCMGLALSEAEVAALENRTEGWIAGLQLAALSMQGHANRAGFIESFSGSHHYVLDYLVEEVLLQQPIPIQAFLLHTAILDRLCGSLCDAVLPELDTPGQTMLETLAQANLFLVPLDHERRWYRYHHLFADLLRQRHQSGLHPHLGLEHIPAEELHTRASQWFEENGLELEAFQHAARANDLDRAERLLAGGGMPLHYRGAVNPVHHWLSALTAEQMDARPGLWIQYASVLTLLGKPVERTEKVLQAGEKALQNQPLTEKYRDLLGQAAAIRAMLSIPMNQVETVMTQARRALEYLHPDNLAIRTTAAWALGYAYQALGDQKAALLAHSEALRASQATGNTMFSIAAATSLGQILESENQFGQAASHYRQVLLWAGDPPLPAACEAHLGLGRIHFHQNELATARFHAQQSLALGQQFENVHTPAGSMLLLARIHLAEGELQDAAGELARAEHFIAVNGFDHMQPDAAEVQAQLLAQQQMPAQRTHPAAQPLIAPLTSRELEILQMIGQGLSNREIGQRLYLALNTVKGYNRKIFNKLNVQRRTEAIVRARELGLL